MKHAISGLNLLISIRSIRGGTTESQAVITRVVTAFILSIEKAPNLSDIYIASVIFIF